MTATYRAEQGIHVSGWECGTEIELKMVVNFTVRPAQIQTMTDPGEDAHAEVDTVQFFEMKNGKPLPDALALPAKIVSAFEESPGFTGWLMQEAADSDEYAREQAADARREELLMENMK